MPKPFARVGDLAQGTCDLGIIPCCPHIWTGPIIVGASRVIVENSPVARIGDIGDCNCPHGGQYKIIAGADRHAEQDNRPLARVGDQVVCMKCGQTGTIITGGRISFDDK